MDYDYPAILLDQESIKRINMLLSPANTLKRDVRSLAGLLGFYQDEVLYIFKKQYPFVYMHDQWIKRDSVNATLKMLHNALIELKRHDAAEIVQAKLAEIHDLETRNPKEILHQVERLTNQLQRCSSTTTLCTTQQTPHQVGAVFERSVGLPSAGAASQKKTKTDDEPDVFVVYFPDNEKHVRDIKRFIRHIRKHRVNATADLFESTQYASDRGFYYYSKLIQSEFVFVVCSTLFLKSYQHEIHQTESEVPEKVKEVSFVMKLILDEIYVNAGVNAKFIPVLFQSSTEDDVPMVLRGSTIYRMPQDYEDLERRVFKVEKYKLGPTGEKPNLRPKQIL